MLKVAVEGGVVKYYRNGTLLYTSTRTPVYPLLVDTSLYNVGDIISQAYISGQLASYVKWTNMHNVSSPPTGGALNRTESTTAWDAGAVSAPLYNQVIDKGGDGYAQYTVSSMSDYIMFGLSNGDSSQHYNDIDYAIYTYASTGYLYTYEGGVSTGSAGTYAVGDTLRVSVEGGKVKYYRNGTLLRTSGKAPVYPLLVDTSIRTAPPGGWIKEPYIYKGIYGGARAEEVVYLHSDHLGSVSTVTNGVGAVVSSQQYDPWGKVRSGGVTQTKLNYTGQRKDDTGLLYYHARYYDPSLARFVSPDSIVPGASSGVGGAGGSVGAWQNSKLTVDFHESGFLNSVKEENALTLQRGFWFQLSDEDKQKATEPWGPHNTQALNRYSYVLNNPLRYVDPTGHYMVSYLHFGDDADSIITGVTLSLSNEEVGQVLDVIERNINLIIYAGASAGVVLAALLVTAGMALLPATLLGIAAGGLTVYQLEKFYNFLKDAYRAGKGIEISYSVEATALDYLLSGRVTVLYYRALDKEETARVPKGPNLRHLCPMSNYGAPWSYSYGPC